MPMNNVWLLLPHFQEALNYRTALSGDIYRISSISLKKYGNKGQKFIYAPILSVTNAAPILTTVMLAR